MRILASKKPECGVVALSILVSLAVVGAGGCGDDSDSSNGARPPGNEGGVCLEGGICRVGLSCVDNICVVSPDAGGGADAGQPGDAAVDGGVPDSTAVDASIFLPCDEEGTPCQSHDPCAIEATCGQDKLCRPTTLQDCDDGRDCTDDVCKGLGMCEHLAREGSCLVPAQPGGKAEEICVEHGEQPPGSPCVMCDATLNPYTWTPLSGFDCDDNEPCTKNDTCQLGVCSGEYYGDSCADEYPCTEDQCDGNGGCGAHTLKPDWCQINSECYQDGQLDITGCKVCDVSKSQSAWSNLSAYCLIGGVCYQPGVVDHASCGVCQPGSSSTAWTPMVDPCTINGRCHEQGSSDPTGCGLCDPAQSASSWTVVGSVCLIHQSCYPASQTDDTGCGICNPTASTSTWTAKSGKCLIGGECYTTGQSHSSGCLVCNAALLSTGWSPNGTASASSHDFEQGSAAGWVITNDQSDVGWTVSSRRSAGGSFALYYGDPTSGNYKGSGSSSGTAALPSVALAAGKQAGITFMLYLDIEADATYDRLQMLVNGSSVWSKDALTLPQMGSWQEINVSLNTFAGQTVTISFEFDTYDGSLNFSEGIYIDDITVYDNC